MFTNFVFYIVLCKRRSFTIVDVHNDNRCPQDINPTITPENDRIRKCVITPVVTGYYYYPGLSLVICLFSTHKSVYVRSFDHVMFHQLLQLAYVTRKLALNMSCSVIFSPWSTRVRRVKTKYKRFVRSVSWGWKFLGYVWRVELQVPASPY